METIVKYIDDMITTYDYCTMFTLKMNYIGNGFLQSDESMKINKSYVV